MRLITWIIEYADGMYQEADAISRKAARQQATHGKPIVGVWTRNQWNEIRESRTETRVPEPPREYRTGDGLD